MRRLLQHDLDVLDVAHDLRLHDRRVGARVEADRQRLQPGGEGVAQVGPDRAHRAHEEPRVHHVVRVVLQERDERDARPERERRERSARDHHVDDLGGDHGQQPERRVLQREEADGRQDPAPVQVEQPEHRADRMPPVDRVLDLGKRLPGHGSIVPSIRSARYAGPMSFDPRSIPVDPAATAALARHGLEYRLLDPADTEAMHALDRGREPGLPPRPPARRRSRVRPLGRLASAACTGSTTDGGAPRRPVATVDGWPTGLSVPGGRSVDAWAVSAVTVSPTHRRRGIARALMEGELANARNAGAAIAMLTVTEATIYGRYGYAPAAKAATVHVDRRRVHWIGPDAPGRVHFVGADELREVAPGHRPSCGRRARPARSTGGRGSSTARSASSTPTATARAPCAPCATTTSTASRRASRPTASRASRTSPASWSSTSSSAATDDAERALWRFLIEQDFVTGVRARLRSVDEPLPWLLEDPRAVTLSDVVDHLWVRVLDPVEALAARRYGSAGTLELEVADPLGTRPVASG